MEGQIENICIRGISSVVPENEVDNLDYVNKIKERRIKKQISLTGIDRRRVSIGNQKASDMAALAAEDLLTRLKWDRNSIDIVIFVTQSPDLSRPASAFLIQERLKLGTDCLVYDINMGCSGYVAGLTTVSSILCQTRGRGLLLVGESNAKCGENVDRNALLEGDAASATALEYKSGCSPMIFSHYSDGARANLLYKPFENAGYMDGNAVLLFGLSDVADGIKKFMKDHRLSNEDVDFFVFHQAQKMIVDGIVQEIQVPEEKVIMSCQNFGNTSSASIPLTLCTELSGSGSSRKRIFMCGFGIGLSWGIMYLEMDIENLFPLIETDFAYNDKMKFGI